MSQTLFVGGLSYGTTKDSLSNYFSGAGNVVSVNLISDRQTGRSKGFGFVEMGSDEEAQTAIDMFNGHDFEGRKLVVNIARPKTEHTGRTGSGFRSRN